MPFRPIKIVRLNLTLAALTLAFTSQGHAELRLDRGAPAEISIDRPALYPEGIAKSGLHKASCIL
jgi:hypothetical protein